MHFTDQYAFTLIQLYSGSFIFINLKAKLNNFSCAWLIVPTLKVFGVNHWWRQKQSFDLFPLLYLLHILKWAVQNANIIFLKQRKTKYQVKVNVAEGDFIFTDEVNVFNKPEATRFSVAN